MTSYLLSYFAGLDEGGEEEDDITVPTGPPMNVSANAQAFIEVDPTSEKLYFTYDPAFPQSLYINSVIRSHMDSAIILAGEIGSKKSTLGTMMYMIMRKTSEKIYCSSQSLISFTKGGWCPSLAFKIAQAGSDKFDVIDLEGITMEQSSQHIFLAALILGKDIVCCAPFGKRAIGNALGVAAVLRCGMKLCEQCQIPIPRPKVFLELPHGQSFYDLGEGREHVPVNQVIAVLREIKPVFKDFDIEIFSIPQCAASQDPTTDRDVIRVVTNLINRLDALRDSMPMPRRVDYLIQVVKAVNANSTVAAQTANKKFFLNALNAVYAQKRDATLSKIQFDHKEKSVLTLDVAYANFKEYESVDFTNTFIQAAKEIPFYTSQFDADISEKCQNKSCVIVVGDLVKDSFDKAKAELKAKLKASGKEKPQQWEKEFRTFVTSTLKAAIPQIHLSRSPALPGDVRTAIETERKRIAAEANKLQAVQVPKDFPSYDYSSDWAILVNESNFRTSRFFVCGTTS